LVQRAIRIRSRFLERLIVAAHVGVSHCFESFGIQFDLPNRTGAAFVQALQDAHDALFDNVTIAVLRPLIVAVVFTLEIVFVVLAVSARQPNRNHESDGLTHSRLDIEDPAGREIA